MADKIKKFFRDKKMEKTFKKAGPGHKLSESASEQQNTPVKPEHQVGPSRAPSDSASKAGAAALARLGPQKEVDWSMAAIRAQARKELELEQQAAAAKAKKEELAPQQKEAAPLVKSGENALLFHCPMLGEHRLPMDELKQEIKSFLFEQIAEEKGLSAALIIVTCNENEAAVKACIDVICKYLTNIIDNPDEQKYRRIKFANRVFQEKVHPIVGALEFLEASGFEEEDEAGEKFLVMKPSAELDLLPALRDALISAEPLEIVLDRNTKVLLPSQARREFEISEEYYGITAEEVAKEQAAKTREAELSLQLRTKAMRDRDAKQENLTYKYTMVRIRLPNEYILQGTFDVNDKLSDVYEFLKESLVEGCSNPVLRSGTQVQDAYSETLLNLRLVPGVMLNCQLEAPPNSQILRPELIALVKEL